jgi:hypothetical protein
MSAEIPAPPLIDVATAQYMVLLEGRMMTLLFASLADVENWINRLHPSIKAGARCFVLNELDAEMLGDV